MTRFEIERQFKKDFAMTLNEAERKVSAMKRSSEEKYYLQCLLGGFDIKTGDKAIIDEKQKEEIQERLNELI